MQKVAKLAEPAQSVANFSYKRWQYSWQKVVAELAEVAGRQILTPTWH